ncbi:MAG: DinB family protein [Terriglobales bacterium]
MKVSLYTAICTLAVALAPLAAAAQTANPVSASLKRSLTTHTRTMVAAAEAMPAEKYSFKPTPESMSFGQLILHVATSNQAMCQWISGAAAAPKPTLTPTSPKDDLVTLLKGSFDYCTQAFSSLDDSKLGSEVPAFGGRTASQAALMMALSDDWADHYSQQAAYLRLNGLLPPTARRSMGRGPAH